MNNLKKIIKNIISNSGALKISEYMNLCLYHNEFGYYTRKNPIGANGDFITSPEISQVFGELLGIWLVQTWRTLGEPEEFNLVELGPGTGTLLHDIWRSTKSWPDFQRASKIYLYEKSKILKEVQKRLLKNIPTEWIDDLNDLPQKEMICFSNEFFDALPIDQYIIKNNTIFEKRISLDDKGELQFELLKADDKHKILGENYKLLENAFFERSISQFEILEHLSKTLMTNHGCILIIDYGGKYGQVDTLQGMYQNKYCDFLDMPGEIDLTSQVDFGVISDFVRSLGLCPSNLITQKIFLTKMGIYERFQLLSQHVSASEKNYLDKALDRLISHTQMGSLMKVLSIKSTQVPNIYPFSF